MPREGPYPFLSFARFRFFLRVTSLMVLPPYKGAVFRGAFGNSLRRLVCTAKGSDCRPCLLRQRCLYIALFEPIPPPGYTDRLKFKEAPRPYVLTPPVTRRQAFHPGDSLDFDLVIIGPALEALPYFIHIFTEIGRKGLGPDRGRYILEQVNCLQNGGPTLVYDGHSRTFANFALASDPQTFSGDPGVTNLTLNFLTPLRLKEKGRLATNLTFPLLFERLAQRLTLLAAFYGNGAKALDLSPLMDQAIIVSTTAQDLRWYDWERFSHRQNAAMKFGGMMGSITFRGELGPFMPCLRLGEALHVGQSTTFGLGKFHLHPREEPHVGR